MFECMSEDARYTITRGNVQECKKTEDLHKMIDRLLEKVEAERASGVPARLSVQIVSPEKNFPIEVKVDEIIGIKPEEFMHQLEVKEKRKAALAKARRAREKNRKAQELIAKKRLAALKKARAAKKSKSKSAKPKKKK